MSFPAVERGDLDRFVRTVFAAADSASWVHLRAFVEGGNRPFAAAAWRAVRIDDGLEAIVDAAATLAETCARAPIPAVFCPPVATFRDSGGAAEDNVASGLVVMIECDAHPRASLARLTALIGAPTILVESGGVWRDPETGAEEEKLHAYWVLDAPTRSPEEHTLLREARDLATRIAGSDASAAPLSHALRWPGSWHRKADPRLSRISSLDADRRPSLADLLTALRAAAPAPAPSAPYGEEETETAEVADVISALEQIPNADAAWDDWNAIGMAVFVATGAADEGREAFDAWSRKSTKYERRTIVDRWRTWHRSPPARTGAGKIFGLARAANPRWVRPSADRPAAGAGDYRLDRRGRVIQTHPGNVRIALRRLRISLSYDAFANRPLYADGRAGGELDDPAIDDIWFRLGETDPFKPNRDFLYTCFGVIAREATFHPVRDWLESLTWDGRPRADTWLIDLAGARVRAESAEAPGNLPYVRAVSRLVLLGAVSRAYRPGCKFDEMLILESRQGTAKSTAIQILAHKDEWFSDSVAIGAGDKETIEKTQGKWLIECGELDKFKERDTESLKVFLSRRTDRARLAYGRLTTELKRSCVMIGTTNRPQYLRDDQNRRFWPLRIERFDLDRLEAEHAQIWAEAVALYKAGVSARLDPALYELAEHEQLERVDQHPWKMTLSDLFGDLTGRVLVNDVFKALGLNRNPGQQHAGQDHIVGGAMRELGWERKRTSAAGTGMTFFYLRGTPEQARVPLYVNVDPATGEVSIGPSPILAF